MQKLSASPKSQYSPWCCTVQMAGVSAYQSECCHGAEKERGDSPCRLFYIEQLFFVVFVYKPIFQQEEEAWESLRPAEAELAAMAAHIYRTGTASSVYRD